MGFFRRLFNIGMGVAAAAAAGLMMKNYQKKNLYEAEFRVIEPDEEENTPPADS